MLIAEAGAIVLLAVAAYVMSLKDKLSLEKQKLREPERFNHWTNQLSVILEPKFTASSSTRALPVGRNLSHIDGQHPRLSIHCLTLCRLEQIYHERDLGRHLTQDEADERYTAWGIGLDTQTIDEYYLNKLEQDKIT